MSYKILLAAFVMFLMVPAFTNAAIPYQENDSEQMVGTRGKEKKDEKPKLTLKERNPNRNANLAFAFGLGSILFPPLAIPALSLGIISLSLNEPNEGFALTGVIIGGLYVLLLIIAIILLFVGVL